MDVSMEKFLVSRKSAEVDRSQQSEQKSAVVGKSQQSSLQVNTF
jgi:hypothetical protein